MSIWIKGTIGILLFLFVSYIWAAMPALIVLIIADAYGKHPNNIAVHLIFTVLVAVAIIAVTISVEARKQGKI